MFLRLSIERDRNFFILVAVVWCFKAILCQSLDGLGPWQQWSGCSVSCGLGEQTRTRACNPHLTPLAPHQTNNWKLSVYANSTGCNDGRSNVLRRLCQLEPCSHSHTESDTSSLASYSYSLSDPSEFPSQYQAEDNYVDDVGEYSPMSKDDDNCTVTNQSFVCKKSTSDEHNRLRRAIRLSLGEMIYSKWTPWTSCSCSTSKKTRYRFCIVGRRQCIRVKGRFPTTETSQCDCHDNTESQEGKRRYRPTRKYPSAKSDPYTSWSNWARCPCERAAFRSRSRMCRPGHEISCHETKKLTGVGVVQVRRCRPRPGCDGAGPMGDLLDQQQGLRDQRENLPGRPRSPPSMSNQGRQVISKQSSTYQSSSRQQAIPPEPVRGELTPDSRSASRFGQQATPPDPVQGVPNRVNSESPSRFGQPVSHSESVRAIPAGSRFEHRYPESFGDFDRFSPEHYRPAFQTAPPPPRPVPVEPQPVPVEPQPLPVELRPMPVEPRPVPLESGPAWSSWSEWDTCSKTCGAGSTYRWRECLEENGEFASGCEGDYTDLQQCNTQPCPVQNARQTSSNMVPEPPVIEESSSYQHPPARQSPAAEFAPLTNRPELTAESEPSPRICRAFTSDTARTGPRRRVPIGALDERSNDQCPAYYGLTIEPPTRPPPPPPPPAAKVIQNMFSFGRRFFG